MCRQGGGIGAEDIRKVAYFEQSIDPGILKVNKELLSSFEDDTQLSPLHLRIFAILSNSAKLPLLVQKI